MPQYEVEKGDTLWKIAEKLLGDGRKYVMIKEKNRLTGDNIRPGQVLTIPGISHSTTNHGATSQRATSILKDEFDNAITSNGYESQRQKYNAFIKSCKYGDIATRSEAAMYLATLLHESRGLSVTKEEYNPVSIAAYGNYIGRGYIQLSSEANYRAASKYFRAASKDFEKDYYKRNPEGDYYVSYPEKVSVDPHAWNVSAWYWKDQVHQYVKNGFMATVTKGIRPLEENMPNRVKIYKKVCEAFHVSQHLK